MKINTRNRGAAPDFEKHRKELAEISCIFHRWEATIEGAAYYSDSDPDGVGDTEQEAIADALTQLRETYESIGKFLAENDPLYVAPKGQ